MRITDNVRRGEPIRFEVDGREVVAFRGETLATALFSANINAFHRSTAKQPRGPFCGIGYCFECLVGITNRATSKGASDITWVLACRTPVSNGMRVITNVCFRERTIRPENGE